MGVTVVALHGFLGEPADWDSVRAAAPDLNWIVPDYTKDPLLSPIHSLDEWGFRFAEWMLREGVRKPILLTGYSQGGRLALHALKVCGKSIGRAVILSSQPGFTASLSEERMKRSKGDGEWARRFEKEDWTTVVQAWNEQPIFFGGSKEPFRAESPAAREAAIKSLRSWSLSKQQDLRPVISENVNRLLWVIGRRDTKYIAVTEELKTHARGLRVDIIEDAGHRLLIDQPVEVAQMIKDESRRMSERAKL